MTPTRMTSPSCKFTSKAPPWWSTRRSQARLGSASSRPSEAYWASASGWASSPSSSSSGSCLEWQPTRLGSLKDTHDEAVKRSTMFVCVLCIFNLIDHSGSTRKGRFIFPPGISIRMRLHQAYLKTRKPSKANHGCVGQLNNIVASSGRQIRE